MPRRLRIGARSSPMAQAQAEQVRAALATHHPGITTEIVLHEPAGVTTVQRARPSAPSSTPCSRATAMWPCAV
ncbi:hypothetical protein ACFQ2B_39265 [Streptomyces stramineus]